MTSYSLPDSTGHPLDKKLDDIFQHKTNGFFIELGAHDGLTQSNSAFFEESRGWTGLLIEPSLSAFELCKANRPNSICLNYACVANDYTDKVVKGDFHGQTMCSVDGMRCQDTHLVEVPASTLEALLDRYAPSTPIDFLSLDTEGYEINILKGLNLDKYRPTYMLIEIYNKDFREICEYLDAHNYKIHSNFTEYNPVTNPLWDGTHNDYLFYDKHSGV